WKDSIELQKAALFRCDVIQPAEAAGLTGAALARYQAVYLLGVRQPSRELWLALKDYVRSGGGLAVVPGGADMQLSAYNAPEAQELLPGKFVEVQTFKAPGAAWDWDKPGLYRHPLLKPVEEWRRMGRADFIDIPRTATKAWLMEPARGEEVL